MRKVQFLGIWSCLLWVAVVAFFVTGTESAQADSESRRIRAIEAVRPCVVSVRAYRNNTKKPGIGSGIILRKDGFIVTNSHVVNKAKVVQVVLASNKRYTARIWKAAPEKDLALLKIEADGLPVAKIGNSDRVRLGQTAIAIGDPLGFEGSVTIGTVGGLGRDIKTGGVSYEQLIQTDAAINPGSSGGALINLDGQVIGINTLVYTGPRSYKHAQGLGFAIPINGAVETAKELIGTQAKVSAKPWLGVSAENLTLDMSLAYNIRAKRGVIVTGVVAGGPAAQAGLQIGDAITSYEGTNVPNIKKLSTLMNGNKAGDTIKLGVWRGDKKITLKVKLDVQSR